MALVKKCRHGRSGWDGCGCAWYADVRVGGERRYVNLGPDRKVAEREHRALVSRVGAGVVVPSPDEARFDALAERWERLQEGRVGPNTMRGYRSALAHALRWFGSTDVRTIRAAHIAEMETALVGAGQSPTYARHCRRAVRAVIGFGIDLGLEATMPDMRRLTTPIRRREARFLTPEQVRAALATLPQPHRDATEFAYLTGMRPGEVIGAEHGDITGRVLRVQRTVHSATGATGPPKNRQERDVDLSARAAELAGVDRGTRRIFGVGYTQWLRYFHDALARAGVEQAGLHALRHSNVALRLAAGQPLVYIADQLGHSTAQFTLKAYGHLLRTPESHADRLDDALRHLGAPGDGSAPPGAG